MATKQCQRCGSEKIIPNIRIVDRWGQLEDDYLAIEIKQNPKALIFKNTHRELISADVCGNVDMSVFLLITQKDYGTLMLKNKTHKITQVATYEILDMRILF